MDAWRRVGWWKSKAELCDGPVGTRVAGQSGAEDLPITPSHPPVETKMLAMMTSPAEMRATMRDTRRPM